MKKLLITIMVICALVPTIFYGVAIYKSMQFNVNCYGYLELAADANSIRIAEKHLTTGIKYLEENNLTDGSTGIIFHKPTNDIGLWYENLKSAQTQLQELSTQENLTELEESNTLMKLRETLMDASGQITTPDNIPYYPNHAFWFWILTLIWILYVPAIICGCIAFVEY